MELPSSPLVLEHKLELAENHAPSKKTHLLSPILNEAKIMESKAESAYALVMLLSAKVIRSTLLMWLVFFGNAFSYYGLVLLTTELTSHNNQCTPTGLPLENSLTSNIYIDVVIASFAEFPELLISVLTVDRLGCKLLMPAMFFICCIFVLPLVHNQFESLTTALLFGACICITGTFTIIYIYARCLLIIISWSILLVAGVPGVTEALFTARHTALDQSYTTVSCVESLLEVPRHMLNISIQYGWGSSDHDEKTNGHGGVVNDAEVDAWTSHKTSR